MQYSTSQLLQDTTESVQDSRVKLQHQFVRIEDIQDCDWLGLAGVQDCDWLGLVGGDWLGLAGGGGGRRQGAH